MPAGLLGLLVASFAAAYMSTISTQLNWGASYLARDIYQRFLDPSASDRRLVAVSRAATVLILLASLLVTYLMGSIEGAWRFLLALGAGTGLVLILRWYWWRINAWSEIAAMAASLVASLLLWFGAGLDPDDPTQWAWIMLATVAVSTVVWLAATFLTAPEPEATLVAFYRRVRPGGRGWARVARAAGLEPEPVAGSPFNALNWVAGVACVYGMLFGIGRLILDGVLAALPWLLSAGISFAWIARDLRRHPERADPAA
jgi:solute:Na+ symporter, SSS family